MNSIKYLVGIIIVSFVSFLWIMFFMKTPIMKQKYLRVPSEKLTLIMHLAGKIAAWIVVFTFLLGLLISFAFDWLTQLMPYNILMIVIVCSSIVPIEIAFILGHLQKIIQDILKDVSNYNDKYL